jgi:hypothetical protein
MAGVNKAIILGHLGRDPEDVMCFGVSATGGDLKDGVHRARYIETPGGSVAWADAQGRVQQRPDLALPLRWALFGDASMRHDL